MKNLYAGLLFLHGHVADADLALSLAQPGEETQAALPQPQPRQIVAKKERRRERGWFRSHAVSSVCCTTALSPFR